MDHSFRIRFGDVECELGVARMQESGFVAWALRVEPDGRVTPLHDKRDRLLLTRAGTAAEALAALREQTAATFGPERESVAPVQTAKA